MIYADRREAGRKLADKLDHNAGRTDVMVLALPRGGVPVAYEVAIALNVPLDVFLVRKLGTPGHEELAMGAIASGGVQILNPDVVDPLYIPEYLIADVANRELKELQRRERAYRGDHPPPEVGGRVVIVVDDGLATGASMRVAVSALRQRHPARIVVAVPVAASDTCRILKGEADEVVCGATPEPFHAAGLWYDNFDQTSDQEVRDLLQLASDRREQPRPRQVQHPRRPAGL